MAELPAHPAHDELRRRWTETLRNACEGSLPAEPLAYADDLLRRWAEPQRRYHTTDHLLAVLRHLDTLTEAAGPAGGPSSAASGAGGADVELVRLAAWFHDAVYLPDRSENEERSARLAERALPEAGLSAEGTEEVARLVRLTITHDPAADDANGALLCDADLAVLASPPEAYASYAASVREEYGFVPDELFLPGRAAVLEQLLALPRLFRTSYGAQHWEGTARRNLRTEHELLTAGS